MNMMSCLDVFAIWMTNVAETFAAAIDRLRAPHRVRLIEESAGCFRVDAGAGTSVERLRIDGGDAALPDKLASAFKGGCVELVLVPDRFLFRPLELPGRAAEFLGGIVRAQIDRLTPWAASDAAFGWTAPRARAQDRMTLTVVATARALLEPHVQACARLGAKTVVIAAALPGEPHATVTVHEHRARGTLDVRRVRRGATAVFGVAVASAAIALVAAQWIGGDIDRQQDDLARRIALRRIAMHRDDPGAVPPQQLLERRKQQAAASVMVIEALSRALPDHTYVTELRIEGDRLQLVGVTQDAPSLIRLLEQSPHFTRATFFAPTTRTPGEAGERFHIEARLRPAFTRT